MKKAFVRERKNPQNKFEGHLRFLVIRNGKEIGAHASRETAIIHRNKVNIQFSYLHQYELTKKEVMGKMIEKMGYNYNFTWYGFHQHMPKEFNDEKYLPYKKR